MADAVKQKLFTLKVLWAGMLSSTMMFLVVLVMVRRGQSSPSAPSLAIPIALGVVSLGLAAASFIIPRHWYRKLLATKKFEIAEEPQPGAFGQYREGSPTQKVFKNPRDAVDRALVLYNTPFILGLALAEAIAIDGLVVGMMGHPIELAIPFFVVGASLVAEKFPSIGFVIKQLEAAHGAKMPP